MMKGSNRRQSIFVFLMLGALATLFFYPVIFQGKTYYAFDILQHFAPWAIPGVDFRAHNTLISDPVEGFYPYYHYLKSSVSEGVFPLWNNTKFCGELYAPPSHPLVYALYVVFPMTVAHDLLLWVHLLGTGLFMVLYLREIGLHPCSSLIGSAAWMFNGYVMVWFEFENVLMMAATLPLILFLMERWFRYRTKTLYTGLICAISLSISVNYAHLLIYQGLFISAYCIWRFLASHGRERDQQGGPGWTGMAQLLLACLLGMGISANFFTNHMSYLEDPQRTIFSFNALFDLIGKLPLKYGATLIFPDFYGSPASTLCFTPGDQIYANYNELCIYGGIPALLLAVACIPYLRENFVAFFLLTALTTLSMAMGSILYYPLASYVPGLSFSTPTRILYVFGFSLSVLAGLGSHLLLRKGDSRIRWAVALWFAALAFGIGLALFVQTEEGIRWAAASILGSKDKGVYDSLRSFFHVFSPILLKPLLLLVVSVYLLCAFVFSRRMVFHVLLVIVLLYDLMSFGWAYNTASPKHLEYPETKGIRLLREDPEPFRVVTYGNILPNTLTPFEIQDIGGYSSFYSKRYGDFLHLSQRGGGVPPPEQHNRWVSFDAFGSPLLDLINVRYLVTSPNVSVGSEKTELIYSDEIKIYRNKAAFPRVFFVPHCLVLGNKEDVYRAMAGFSAEDFRNRVILESPPPPGFDAQEQEENLMDSRVTITAYGQNRIDLDVSARKRGFVVIGDSYHTGWRARVDGDEVPVMRANSILRAIPVNQGEHKVTLVFRPGLLLAGMLVSAVGWMALLLLLGTLTFPRQLFRRGKEKAREPDFLAGDGR
jgi:hypothetical protein